MEEECCKWVDKTKWDKKTHVWKDKPFYTAHYRSILCMPLTMGKIMNNMLPELAKKKLLKDDSIMLCRNEGMWGGDINIELNKVDPELPIEKISGKLFSMYFETNSYRDVGKFFTSTKNYCEAQGWKPTELMSYYCTCPTCTKKFGKMQIVILAKLE
jgi:hypothetical protein